MEDWSARGRLRVMRHTGGEVGGGVADAGVAGVFGEAHINAPVAVHGAKSSIEKLSPPMEVAEMLKAIHAQEDLDAARTCR